MESYNLYFGNKVLWNRTLEIADEGDSEDRGIICARDLYESDPEKTALENTTERYGSLIKGQFKPETSRYDESTPYISFRSEVKECAQAIARLRIIRLGLYVVGDGMVFNIAGLAISNTQEFGAVTINPKSDIKLIPNPGSDLFFARNPLIAPRRP